MLPPGTTSEEAPAPSLEMITVREEVIVSAPVENQAHYKEISLTDDEWFWLGQLIYAEAGNQTDLGKRAVVEAVFNRCLDPRFPDAVADVIFAPHQFTDASWVDAQTAAAQYPIIEMVLLEEYPALREDVVFFATYVANGTLYEQIGAHYFCY